MQTRDSAVAADQVQWQETAARRSQLAYNADIPLSVDRRPSCISQGIQTSQETIEAGHIRARSIFVVLSSGVDRLAKWSGCEKVGAGRERLRCAS